jgi:hypothetical protein
MVWHSEHIRDDPKWYSPAITGVKAGIYRQKARIIVKIPLLFLFNFPSSFNAVPPNSLPSLSHLKRELLFRNRRIRTKTKDWEETPRFPPKD